MGNTLPNNSLGEESARFWFKLWYLNTCLGYLVPHQGGCTQIDRDPGLGGSVVVDLLSKLPSGIISLLVSPIATETES